MGVGAGVGRLRRRVLLEKVQKACMERNKAC